MPGRFTKQRSELELLRLVRSHQPRRQGPSHGYIARAALVGFERRSSGFRAPRGCGLRREREDLVELPDHLEVHTSALGSGSHDDA